MSVDDAALVRLCLLGNPDAIGILVARYHSDVFGMCVRLLRHQQDAEDVTQEVFLRVFRSLERWDSTRPLRPWIVGIAINRCRTWLGLRSRRPETVDFLDETLVAPNVNTNETRELSAEIQSAVQDLREDYRTVFVLFHEQGQGYEDIARAIDRPVGTVKTWLHRARMEILERLKRRGLVEEETRRPTSGE